MQVLPHSYTYDIPNNTATILRKQFYTLFEHLRKSIRVSEAQLPRTPKVTENDRSLLSLHQGSGT